MLNDLSKEMTRREYLWAKYKQAEEMWEASLNKRPLDIKDCYYWLGKMHETLHNYINVGTVVEQTVPIEIQRAVLNYQRR